MRTNRWFTPQYERVKTTWNEQNRMDKTLTCMKDLPKEIILIISQFVFCEYVFSVYETHTVTSTILHAPFHSHILRHPSRVQPIIRVRNIKGNTLRRIHSF